MSFIIIDRLLKVCILTACSHLIHASQFIVSHFPEHSIGTKREKTCYKLSIIFSSLLANEKEERKQLYIRMHEKINEKEHFFLSQNTQKSSKIAKKINNLKTKECQWTDDVENRNVRGWCSFWWVDVHWLHTAVRK